nr:RNA-directed DNA polymerase, eukaryota [Tanacetum cinerariifolium]
MFFPNQKQLELEGYVGPQWNLMPQFLERSPKLEHLSIGTVFALKCICKIEVYLKSVLGASPLYNMSIYKVPKGVLKEMEAIRCNFFNGAEPAERTITWVSWDKVLASKKNGGLGVSSFHALNRALLLKSVWHFLSQDGSLWFPRLFALETDKESTVASKLRCSSVDASFRRSVRDGVERQQWDDLNSVSGFVVGGIWTGTIYCPFQIRMLGFLLFGFRLGSS